MAAPGQQGGKTLLLVNHLGSRRHWREGRERTELRRGGFTSGAATVEREDAGKGTKSEGDFDHRRVGN